MASIDLGGMAVPETALAWKFVRATGPGGQNVNKVSTAVECRLNLDAAGIRGGVRERLERIAGSRLNAAGEVVVFVDTHRSQFRNREAALARLAALVEVARPEPRPRVPTRPTAGARARRRDEKKRRGAVKKLRSSVDSRED
ncbi:MAG: alternative ribosome rescue aminoacyl-tRNA hydrolase ArfB [Immundisolibacterales bacterium]|nr:alternative ribosome rescue aminoacyl-tRNA hydrolase ArfB [Immundisolibacterales bacterium]